MKYYLVFWHKTDHLTNGWDLVYTKNKREARAKYKTQHYSPIHAIVGPDDEDYDMLVEGIHYEEFARAQLGEVVNIEEGT